jgi:phosphoenolpyruvate synthase/pyruvate phosphate dikinase
VSSSRTGIVWLDEGRAINPVVVGAKAAMLAKARAAGLPVLDGFVVPAHLSTAAVVAGVRALEAKHSGYARTTVIGAEMAPVLVAELASASRGLGNRLVVRSSSVVEGAGLWAGAFASYAEMTPDEVPQGVKGCWASIFTPDALERGEHAAVGPEDVGMAVLIQTEIQPDYGGVATVDRSGAVTIAAIRGTPAAIVSGWERGHVLSVVGEDILPAQEAEAIGRERVKAVADLARRTVSTVDCHHIEWAETDGRLWLLQAQVLPPLEPVRPEVDTSVQGSIEVDHNDLVRRIREEVRVRDPGLRLGITKWEPTLYKIVSTQGTRCRGLPAASGWGVGRVRFIRGASDAAHFEPREIVAAMYPLSNLAPLLWNAAGIVTIGGSPGAHLFEVAAWLGVPAVCGVDLQAATGKTLELLGRSRSMLGAIDGDAGDLSLLKSGYLT